MTSRSLEFTSRSTYCGDVRSAHVGQELVLKGWVHRRRDHGGLIFIDLRDRAGLLQIRFNPDTLENDQKIGVSVAVNWNKGPQELVQHAQALKSTAFELQAVTKGEVNVYPDGNKPKEEAGVYSLRFYSTDRKKWLKDADVAAFAAELKAHGFAVAESSFVSITHTLREEFVVAVRGTVEPRPAGATNPNLATGEVEIEVKELKVLNPCGALPFKINETGRAAEELRLRYRYLDLRRPELQRHLIVRHQLYQATRRYLSDAGFIEFETPILARPTPEGARDFLVPSRLNPGMCYALPQSPQLFKQILMVAGFDKYFQIARCFRDEDLRANRQPEFTQIDIEMSFVGVDDVIPVMEGLTKAMWRETLGIDIQTPFRRMPYSEAMRRYGSDKPDLRFGMELQDLTPLIKDRTEFSVFKNIIEKGGSIISVLHQGGADKYSNTSLRPEGEFQKRVQREIGSRGVAFFRLTADGQLDSSIAKFFAPEVQAEIIAKSGMVAGDILFMIADNRTRKAQEMAGKLRLMIARDHNMIPKNVYEFLWVVDFPLFEYNEDEKRFDPAHHPFTSPHPEDLENLETDPGNMRALAYDLALNGEEIAGGSIRIHRSDIQSRLFKAIGIGEEEAKNKFGFLLEGLELGAPPHGGIAFGFDRLLMSILDVESIREVIAFPKTQTGTCLMTGAPGDVTEQQLKEVHVMHLPKKDKDKEKA